MDWSGTSLRSDAVRASDPAHGGVTDHGGTRGLMSLMEEPVIGLDRQGCYRYFNEAALRLKGLKEADLVGRRMWEVFPQGLGSILHHHCDHAVEHNVPVHFEAFYSPYQAWFEVHIYPSDDGLWLIFRDITPRKNAEHELQESERRFRQLFEDVPVALYRTSPDGTLLDVNAALVRMLKYPDIETFMRVNAADVYVDPSDRTKWQALLDSGANFGVFQMRDRCFDGTVIWVRDTATAVRDSSGAILYYQGTLEDVTERKESEEALRESEARFRLLATASDDVIWDWDVVSGEVRWNAALKSVFGFAPEDVGPGIEHSYAWWIAHIHADDRARCANGLHTAVQGSGNEWVGEYRFRRLDGRYARVVDRCYIGRDENGNAIRIIGSIIDLDRGGRRRRHETASATTPASPPVPVSSDATLVSWVARGAERAFEDLYARHASFVFAVAQPLLQDTAETDEVVADVFLHIWKNASQFDISRGTVSAWVANIARARALERVRKAGRRDRLSRAKENSSDVASASNAYAVPGSDVDEIDPATEAMLQRSLAQLPEPQRKVIELAYFNGLSHAEIAHRLNEPLGTVKTRLRAGLQKLRRGFPPA